MSVGRRIARGLARVGHPQGLAPAHQRVVYDEVATYRHDEAEDALKRHRATLDRSIADAQRRMAADPSDIFAEALATSSLEPVAHIIKEGYEHLDRLSARNQARTGEQIFLDALNANLSPAETAEIVRELQRRGGITTPGAVRDGSAAIQAFWSVGP